MSLQTHQRQSSGFGKRGYVEPPQPVGEPASAKGGNNTIKWIGGGALGLALLGLIGAGTSGGGSLLGALIGGLLGQKLAQSATKAQTTAAQRTAAPAPTTAPASTTVQRSGFGTTAATSASSSGS
jgi:hypothetical protein